MKERDERYNMRRQYTVSSSAFTVPSIISRKKCLQPCYALGMKFRCFFNRFHPRVEPISAWKFVYRWIECKFKKRSHFDDEQYCVFLFFCQLTSIVESHGISQIDELSLRENIDALPRAILSIVLCTKDENLSSNR